MRILFILACILAIGCGESDDAEIANLNDIVCKDGNAELQFDATPTHIYVEYNVIGREDFFPTNYFKWDKWEIVGNNVIMQRPDVFLEGWNRINVVVIRWGLTPNDQRKEFEFPCP